MCCKWNEFSYCHPSIISFRPKNCRIDIVASHNFSSDFLAHRSPFQVNDAKMKEIQTWNRKGKRNQAVSVTPVLVGALHKFGCKVPRLARLERSQDFSRHRLSVPQETCRQ